MNITGTTTLNGIQTDDFNPEVADPTASTAEAIEPPQQEEKQGETTKSFQAMMSGHTEPKKGSQSSLEKLRSKPKKTVRQSALKINAASLYDKIIAETAKNYLGWPERNGNHYKEKGSVMVMVKDGTVFVKYGSRRVRLLEELDQSLLPNILEVVSK